MIKTAKKWLFDIVNFGEKVGMYLGECESFVNYTSDEKTKLAVERCLEIIGEACHKLRKGHQIIFPDSDRAYNFRGSLIHQYDQIKDQTIYQFATQSVPKLVLEARQLLNELAE